MQQLTGLDASMLYMETPQTPNHVGAWYTYDPSTAPGGAVSFDDIVENIRSRLGRSRMFRRTLVKVPFGLDHPYWIEDGDFALEDHVHRVTVPSPGSWRQLCDLVAELYERPIDLRRPPWELYVIEGLAEGVDGIAHPFATLVKIHHAAVDGVSGAELMTVLHDHQPIPATRSADDDWRPEPQPAAWDLLSKATVNNLTKPMHAMRVARRMAPTALRLPLEIGRGKLQAPPTAFPETRFNVPVGTHRSIDAIRAPLEEVKRSRSAVPGATVNDAVMTVVGGALRRYLDASRELPDESLVAMVPISTRTKDDVGTGGNQIAMMTSTLATDEADPLKRLRRVSAAMTGVKDLANAMGARALSDLSNAVPGLLLGIGSRAQSRAAALNLARPPANTTVTNVPGPPEPLYFTGARVVGPYGAGPLAHRMGIIHLIGSYAGQFAFSFTADRAMMPDPEFYAECLQDSLDELLVVR